MKKTLLLFLSGCIGLGTMAQVPEDVLNLTWYPKGGTARAQGFGGAMNAMGGDLTTLFANPAGLGFYKTNEFTFSPSLYTLNGKADYRGSNANADPLSKFTVNTTGIILSNQSGYSRWTSKVVGIGVSRTADFNSTTFYNGQNNYSTFSEGMANEFFDFYVNQRQQNPSLTNEEIIDEALSSNSVSLRTRMGLYSYLIDVVDDGTNSTVISRAEEAGNLIQSNMFETGGGITEISIGYGLNMDDRIYIGGSIGAPILNYTRTGIYREENAAGPGNGEFNYSELRESFTAKGMGINAKLGLIFKPVKNLRVGATVHTPTAYGMKEQSSLFMRTDINDGGQPYSVSSRIFTDDIDPVYNYDFTTPWKFGFGMSYMISESADITRQRGFISADIEFLNYEKTKFKSFDQYDESYFNELNAVVRDMYRNVMNFRVGGEMKFTDFLARVGYGYYGNPYAEAELKGNIQNISGGLGYRNRGLFADIAYVHSIRTNVHFPYRVEAPRANTFAETKNTAGNIILTVGIKF